MQRKQFTPRGPKGRKRRWQGRMTGRRHRHGPRGPGHGEWGPGGWGGHRGFGGRRRRMRRGDVRAALLVLLDEQPFTGYGLMQEIEQRSGGAWRPSPGSVYPTLAQLEDEGLVTAGTGETRKPYELSDAGRTYVAEHRDELGEPWAAPAEGVGESRLELRNHVGGIGAAVMQVAAAGDDEQVKRAGELLAETRRGLYRILADDDPRSDA